MEATVDDKEKEFRSNFSMGKLLVPVLIGLIAASFLLYKDLSKVRFVVSTNGQGEYVWVDSNGDGRANLTDVAEFQKVGLGAGGYHRVTYRDLLRSVNWTWYSTFWIFMALLFTAFRDLGYIYRIRSMTDRHLSWRSSFDVIMLWEFASALTPSVVGGSGVAMFILNREKIALGRSTAVVLLTALQDELFYVIMVPVIFLLIGSEHLFPASLDNAFYGFPVETVFWIGYSFIVLLVCIVFYAVFFKPRAFKYVLLQVFRIKFLKRWRYLVVKVGDDIITASWEFRRKPFSFWSRTMAATLFSWTSRFLVVNFIVMAFFPVKDHLLMYGRQLVMWVILLISPTPGSSGVAEVAFSGFFRDIIVMVGFIGTLAIIWRILTYYLYLFVGVLILPRWLRRTRPTSP